MTINTHERSPAWRSVLEERWQQRLSTVTTLSLAYHDAVERSGGAAAADDRDAGARRIRRLLRDATAARRALRDTEEALARLSGGSYGRCEQCSAPIPTARLLAEPEARYCPECVKTTSLQRIALPCPGRADAAAARPGRRECG